MNSIGVLARVLDNNLCEVTFDRETILEAHLPIKVPDGCRRIRIVGTDPTKMVKVTLKSQKETQPCIGHETNDDMSFGRWSRNGYDLDEIILDNVDLICIGYCEKPFTLGSYGSNLVPRISIMRDSKIYCPETVGERVITKWATAPEGSTKISERMEYLIIPPGKDRYSLISEDCKKVIDEIAKYRKDIYQRADCSHEKYILENLLYCVKCDDSIDFDYWLKKRGNDTYWMTLKTCAVLTMPLEFAGSVEFLFECKKVEWLRKQYTSIPDDMECSAGEFCAAIIQDFINKNTDYTTGVADDMAWDYLYEMIPTYFHTFEPKERTHREEVLQFLADNPNKALYEKYIHD